VNKHVLYLNLYQVATSDNCDAPLIHVTDFDREVSVLASRNSSGRLSHIAIEFAGLKSKFLCSLVFDGSGELGIDINGFAMPRVKLRQKQKAMALLSCLEFLKDQDVVQFDIEFMADRIGAELTNGSVSFFHQYKRMTERSANHAESIPPVAPTQSAGFLTATIF